MPVQINPERRSPLSHHSPLSAEPAVPSKPLHPVHEPFVVSNCYVVNVVNGTVDGTPRAILVMDGRLVNILEDSISSRFKTYDGGGGFIVPGLIDMHVHVTLNPHLRLESDPLPELDPKKLRQNSMHNVAQALDSGITTMRDLGGRLRMPQIIRDQVNQGEVIGPRLVVAGEMITCRHGHGTEDHFRFGAECDTLDDVRLAVQRNCEEGADWVKVTTQGGPHPGELSFKHIETAVQTAHANGRRIACHAHFNEASIAKAVEARVDSLEHGCVLTPDLAKRMAEFDVAYCPTLEIVARLAEEPALFGVKSESFIKKIREIRQKHLESVHLAKEAGVKIVAGTDAGIAHLEFDGLHRELYRLEQAGLARQDALKAATVTAGNVLAIPAITGILAPGALADFLITSTNPLVDLSTLRKPVAVFVGGRMVRGTLGEASDRLRIDEHSRVN